MAIAKRITLGSGDPKRLFVGGLHGDEWMHTSALLESLDAPETGTLVIIPKLTDRAYVSTLDDRYYEGYGRDLVAAIEEINPAIYLELHSYRDFEGLTDFRRIDEKGVPAYVELEDGVLIGSISPILRRRCFSVRDFCVSFEIPAEDDRSQKLAKELLDFTKDCVSVAEQGRRAIENYKRFYGI
jgi:hypothetical protein